MLGGSSSLNGAIYARGNPKDYDNWASMGNRGWSFNDLLPLFKRAEDFLVKNVSSSKNAQGFGAECFGNPFKALKLLILLLSL